MEGKFKSSCSNIVWILIGTLEGVKPISIGGFKKGRDEWMENLKTYMAKVVAKGYDLSMFSIMRKPSHNNHAQIHYSTLIHYDTFRVWDMTDGCQDNILEWLSW